jgi:geranylgeranyl reductase family protein
MIIEPVYNLDCDVLIIGGGPAGSGLAIYLRRKGISVWVVEAEKFPRDKVCGDALSPLAVKELQLLGITEIEGFKSANEITSATIFVDDDEIGDIILPPADDAEILSKVIPRIKLDNWIHLKAKEEGAKYLEEHRLVDYTITSHYATARVKNKKKTIEIKAKLIVGADGASSTVARLLHGEKPPIGKRLYALRAYFENIAGPAEKGQIYFSRESFPGIYWVFPSGSGNANIGLGMVVDTLPTTDTHIKKLLENHINDSPNLKKRIGEGTMTGKIQAWPLSSFNPDRPIVDNRILLIGDAAGLINSLSGDGMQYALQASNWASGTIHDCVTRNDFSKEALQPFENCVYKKLGTDFAFADIIVQFGKNKAFDALTIRFLRVLIERSRKDPKYGSIIGGVFGGTYPSYSVLSPTFVLKTFSQMGIHVANGALSSLMGGKDGLQTTAMGSFNEVKRSIDILTDTGPQQVDWAKDLLKKIKILATGALKGQK